MRHFIVRMLLCLLVVGCSNVTFERNSKGSNIDSGLPGDPNNPVIGDPKNPVIVALRTLQPALAVRGISCLMCHADVRANVITDFGHGNSWYLGGEQASFDVTQNWYNNVASSWQSAAQIRGSLVVPNAEVTRAAQSVLGPDYTNLPLLKLDEFLNIPYRVNWNFIGEPAITISPVTLKVQPEPGKDKVIAKNEIIIRAPTETEILDLAPSLRDSNEVSGAIRRNSLEELQLVQRLGSEGKNYTTNQADIPFQCANADIIVKGTLYLNNLRVNASNGCRLYVSGTVFIEGPITYTGEGPNHNIQISSANAIVMGISVSRLQDRLISDHRGLQITGEKNYSERARQTMSEASNIRVLMDAQDDYSGGRASFDYNGILLNAPLVHSRYLGQIHGTIIAEAALFALGQFHFDFDDVFTRVDVLPLLIRPVLVAR